MRTWDRWYPIRSIEAGRDWTHGEDSEHLVVDSLPEWALVPEAGMLAVCCCLEKLEYPISDSVSIGFAEWGRHGYRLVLRFAARAKFTSRRNDPICECPFCWFEQQVSFRADLFNIPKQLRKQYGRIPHDAKFRIDRAPRKRGPPREYGRRDIEPTKYEPGFLDGYADDYAELENLKELEMEILKLTKQSGKESPTALTIKKDLEALRTVLKVLRRTNDAERAKQAETKIAELEDELRKLPPVDHSVEIKNLEQRARPIRAKRPKGCFFYMTDTPQVPLTWGMTARIRWEFQGRILDHECLQDGKPREVKKAKFHIAAVVKMPLEPGAPIRLGVASSGAFKGLANYERKLNQAERFPSGKRIYR